MNSGDLNNELVRYSDHGDLFGHQMVFSSDHHLVNRPLFRPPFEYQSAIQMPGSMVPAIWIAYHLNNEQVKVCYSDAHCRTTISIDCSLTLSRTTSAPFPSCEWNFFLSDKTIFRCNGTVFGVSVTFDDTSNLRLNVLFDADDAMTFIKESVWGLTCSRTIDSNISFFCRLFGVAISAVWKGNNAFFSSWEVETVEIWIQWGSEYHLNTDLVCYSGHCFKFVHQVVSIDLILTSFMPFWYNGV